MWESEIKREDPGDEFGFLLASSTGIASIWSLAQNVSHENPKYLTKYFHFPNMKLLLKHLEENIK